MIYHVTINGIDLGQTMSWQAPTELVEQAVKEGRLTEADLAGEHKVVVVDRSPPPPQEHVPAADPNSQL